MLCRHRLLKNTIDIVFQILRQQIPFIHPCPHLKMVYSWKYIFRISLQHERNDAPGEEKNGSRHLSPKDHKCSREKSEIKLVRLRVCNMRKHVEKCLRFCKTFRKR